MPPQGIVTYEQARKALAALDRHGDDLLVANDHLGRDMDRLVGRTLAHSPCEKESQHSL